MAAGRSLEMKIPTRPAPAPPGSTGNSKSYRPGSHLLDFDNCDPFEDQKYARLDSTLGEKKKPPPRPPPPKLQPKAVNRKQAPTQLLSNLFTRKTSGRNNNRPVGEIGIGSKQTLFSSSSSLASYGSSQQPPPISVPSGTLIDLNSPPASPTLTTRSSSDGVESGFEDDFDFFTASSNTTPTVSDPWCDSNGPQDPFSPTWRASPSVPPTIFELSSEDPNSQYSTINNTLPSNIIKPTIIRAYKGNKPARPPPIQQHHIQSSQPIANNSSLSLPTSDANWSPPMPSVPPPPPPPEALQVLLNGPQLPPRPTTLIGDKIERKKPYCIALYDYEASHPDDLSFKVNDVITLISRVNEEWLRGQIMGKEGIFPENFVNIVVPLDEQPADTFDNDTKAIALYTFTPESWDDLQFQEGDTVRILKRINDDWLYGECNGKRGQFPASFVSSIYLDIES
ncbi:SH3 domain-containing lethal (3) 05822 isoform X2 [Lycorma delicatula]|uniref:SH3 domain-containing lethal (3) 05822 isoform X2 n=1 Tax=Lycorma delicatula TaxID=130591 RepID=UPI003F514D16